MSHPLLQGAPLKRKHPGTAPPLARASKNVPAAQPSRLATPTETGFALRQQELRDNQTVVPLPFVVSRNERDREERKVIYVSASREGFSALENLFLRYRSLIDRIDPSDANAPTRAVERILFQVLLRCGLMGFPPARVDISIEGGAIVQFVNGKTYADIELLNEGEILASCSRPGFVPEVWALEGTDPEDLSKSLERLRAFIHGKK